MTDRGAVIAAVTVVGAVAGALLGSRWWNLDSWRLLVVLAVATSLGVAVALLVTTTAPIPRTAPTPGPTPERVPERGPDPVPEPTPEPTPRPTAGPAAAGGRAWWNEDARRERPAAAAPSGYDADRAVVAQCPRCADFQLDVRRDGAAYAFHCRNPNCGNRWTWRAGTAWPTTVVRRNLTG